MFRIHIFRTEVCLLVLKWQCFCSVGIFLVIRVFVSLYRQLKCMVFVNIFFLHMRFPVRRLKSHLMKFYTTNLNTKRRLWAMHTPQKSPANAFVVSSSDLTMVW